MPDMKDQTSLGLYGNDDAYEQWIYHYDTLNDTDRASIKSDIARLNSLPLFSIVPAPNAPADDYFLGGLLISLRQQLYPFWEIVLPAESGQAVEDPRIRFVGDPSSLDGPTSSERRRDWFKSSLRIAEGDFVVPLPADAVLAEHALYEMALAISQFPAADLVYGDEDRLGSDGARYSPWFKTAWDPDLAWERDTIGIAAAYRTLLLRTVLERVPATMSEAAGLFAVALWTARAAAPEAVRHVPAILCHRTAPPHATRAQGVEEIRTVVRKGLAEEGIAATVAAAPAASHWSWVMRDPPNTKPLVTIIIPTRDRADLLEGAITSILAKTDYRAFEILVIDNDSCEPETLTLFRRLSANPQVRVLPYPGRFNYAAMNNFGVRAARGSLVLLLNNDIEVIRPGWLEALVAHAVRPEIGAVGARLLYADGRVQHAGMVFQPGIGPVHQYRFASRDEPGPAEALCLTRTVTMVTGACLMIRRAVYEEVGGLDEAFRVAFNDVDLCMRLGDYGYRNICTPAAELFHLESASRGYDVTPEQQAVATAEFERFRSRWGSLLDTDPYRNPNVNYVWNATLIAAPPQRPRPWLR